MTQMDLNNMNGIERVLRLFFGCCLIGSVMITPFSFEYLVLLPLIGIYPCMTAIVGWDPVYFVFDINRPRLESFIQQHLVPDTGDVTLLTPRSAI